MSIQTYVIIMPNSLRHQKLINSLNSMGMEYKIFEAVVGENLSDQEIRSRVNLESCDARLGYRFTKQSIGCGLSHKLIHIEALENSYEWVLIFEEDVELVDFNLQEIKAITKVNNSQATIIQLFSRSSRIMKSNSIEYIPESKRIIFDFEPRLIGSGASAYLINRRALIHAVESKLLEGPSDWPAWSSQVKFKGVYPWMISETAAASTIPNNQIKRTEYVKRRLLQVTGLHYLRYRGQYMGVNDYFKGEIIPYLVYIKWRITGSNYYLNDPDGPQVIP
jgi:GR25 family glycosyltransferase involved in LPS biosynthesis